MTHWELIAEVTCFCGGARWGKASKGDPSAALGLEHHGGAFSICRRFSRRDAPATGVGFAPRHFGGAGAPAMNILHTTRFSPPKIGPVFFRGIPKIATPCNALILIAGGKEPKRKRRKARRHDMTLIATDVMASVMVSVMARSMVDENDDDSRRVKPTLNHISKTHGRAPLLCPYRIAPALSRVARLPQRLVEPTQQAVCRPFGLNRPCPQSREKQNCTSKQKLIPKSRQDTQSSDLSSPVKVATPPA